MDITGSVALVTGANRGLGRQFAQQLVERGAKVYATSRRPELIDLPGVEVLRVDITDPESVAAAAAAAGDVSLLGWRAVVALPVVSLLVMAALWPVTPSSGTGGRLDVKGAVLVGAAASGLVLLVQSPSSGVLAASVGGLLLARLGGSRHLALGRLLGGGGLLHALAPGALGLRAGGRLEDRRPVEQPVADLLHGFSSWPSRSGGERGGDGERRGERAHGRAQRLRARLDAERPATDGGRAGGLRAGRPRQR